MTGSGKIDEKNKGQLILGNSSEWEMLRVFKKAPAARGAILESFDEMHRKYLSYALRKQNVPSLII